MKQDSHLIWIRTPGVILLNWIHTVKMENFLKMDEERESLTYWWEVVVLVVVGKVVARKPLQERDLKSQITQYNNSMIKTCQGV